MEALLRYPVVKIRWTSQAPVVESPLLICADSFVQDLGKALVAIALQAHKILLLVAGM